MENVSYFWCKKHFGKCPIDSIWGLSQPTVGLVGWKLSSPPQEEQDGFLVWGFSNTIFLGSRAKTTVHPPIQEAKPNNQPLSWPTNQNSPNWIQYIRKPQEETCREIIAWFSYTASCTLWGENPLPLEQSQILHHCSQSPRDVIDRLQCFTPLI